MFHPLVAWNWCHWPNIMVVKHVCINISIYKLSINNGLSTTLFSFICLNLNIVYVYLKTYGIFVTSNGRLIVWGISIFLLRNMCHTHTGQHYHKMTNTFRILCFSLFFRMFSLMLMIRLACNLIPIENTWQWILTNKHQWRESNIIIGYRCGVVDTGEWIQ